MGGFMKGLWECAGALMGCRGYGNEDGRRVSKMC